MASVASIQPRRVQREHVPVPLHVFMLDDDIDLIASTLVSISKKQNWLLGVLLAAFISFSFSAVLFFMQLASK